MKKLRLALLCHDYFPCVIIFIGSVPVYLTITIPQPTRRITISMTFSSGSLSGPNMGIDLAVIQPRNVYRVPVHFFRKAYPIKFLEEDRNGDYRLNKEGNYWKNIFSADGRSQSISQEDWEKEKDVVIQTGPRPFLVLLKGQHLIRVRNLSLPKWIGDAVAGLEITSIKDKMRYDHPDLYRQVLSGEGSSGHVFLYRNAALSKDLIRSRLKTIGKRVGVKVYPHRLRHTWPRSY